jgi:Tol biopolymer transport system component
MLAVGAIVGWKLIASTPESQLLHAMITEPPGARFDMDGRSPGPATLSPNGKMVAFVAMGEDNVSHLYLRHLDQGQAVKLSGTEDAAYPFWSPDSDYIGFFSVMTDRLRKIAVSGGPPVTLCTAENGKGGSWNPDGVIIFAPTASGGLSRVPSIGGDPEPITAVGKGENSHRHPRFLPNGQDFLFAVRGIDGDSFSIRMGSLDGREPVDVAPTESQAEFADGHLFTTREGVLFATPFDPATGKLTGGGTPLVEQVLIAGLSSAAGSYSVLPSGMMLFQTGSGEEERVISWTDLGSQRMEAIGSTGKMFFPRISPDGRRCLVEVFGESQEGGDLWLVDLDSGQRTRFTFEEGDEVSPCWTPDGSTVIYTSRASGVNRIMARPLEGTAAPVILLEAGERLMTTSTHPDGSGVLFHREFADTIGTNLEFLAFDGDGTSTVILPREGYGGRYSPDGRWIAYGWRSAADWDVFVMPAEGGTRKWQVTTTGTGWPQWQPDGKRLFVVGMDGTVMAHDVATQGSTFRFGAPEIFTKLETPGNSGIPFTVHPDGKRIIAAGRDPSKPRADHSPIHLVTDWRRALAR